MRSRNIKIGKVRAIRFVEVIVAVVEGVSTARNHWLEQVSGFLGCWLEIDLVVYAPHYPDMPETW